MRAAKPRDLPRVVSTVPTSRRAFLGSMSLILGRVGVRWSQTRGQGDEPGGATPAPMEAMRRMAERVALTQTTGGGQSNPVVLRQEPLIRYGDPANNVLDGTVGAWGDRGRATALLKLDDRGGHAGETFWGMSVTSLSTDRVALEFDGLELGVAVPGMRRLRPLPDAPRLGDCRQSPEAISRRRPRPVGSRAA